MANKRNEDLFGDRPREVNVAEFVQARALEITNLMSVIDNRELPSGEVAQGPRTFLQRQPRHMRRRAMSYNVKRLPRRYRRQASEYLADRKHAKKPPSRFYRRKPSNLLKSYANRQRKHRWLETHIWHAKRFRMVDAFGWKLPATSCQRGFRAVYRDAVRHCVVQDISYFSCLQLVGPEAFLLEKLCQMCPPDVGLSFKSPIYLDGSREGRTILYQPAKYPLGCIGVVSFVWDVGRSLMIWAHPAIESTLIKCLVDLFGLETEEIYAKEETIDENVSNVDQVIQRSKQNRRKAAYVSRIEEKSVNVTLNVLNENFVRFRLVGPKSTAIVREILTKPQDLMTNSKETQEYSAWDAWQELYANLEPGAVDPRKIISLMVTDPRLKTDYKKKRPDDVFFKSNRVPASSSSNNFARSTLWDAETRECCLKTKISDADLNKMRSNIPLAAKFNKSEHLSLPNLVPVVLCHQAGQVAAAAGWDLVLPAGWGMPFWLALQFRTARAAGFEFQRKIAFETSSFDTLGYFPDTPAGVEYGKMIGDSCKQKYLRRPPNRRFKYSSLKIKYPFEWPWAELIDGWRRNGENEEKTFCVLRNRKILQQLRLVFTKKKKHVDWQRVFFENPNLQEALVPVKIVSVGKGVPKPFAIICLPDVEDFTHTKDIRENSIRDNEEAKMDGKKAKNDDKWTEFVSLDISIGDEVDISEMFVDRNEEKRLNRKAKAKLKRKAKKSTGTVEAMNMAEDQKPNNVVDSCRRKVIGFVVDGDFSFSHAKGVGLGFCSFVALTQFVEMSNDNQAKLLYRNTNSRLYRACMVEVCISL